MSRLVENIRELQFDTLEVDFLDGVLTITVARPQALNALNPTAISELRTLVSLLRSNIGDASTPADWSVRGIILVGAGDKSFVAGADIKTMQDMTSAEAAQYAAEADELTVWFEQLPIPIVAAVNGYAFGGGMELAMSTDIIFASKNAVFGQPEVSLGLIPGFGGCVRLQQWVGQAIARDVIMTGRQLSADDAQHAGLVSAVLPDRKALLSRARDFIAQTAQHSAVAVSAAKRTIRAVGGLSTQAGLEHEQAAFAACFDTADMREGTLAFVEKRKPQFPSTTQA